MSSVFHRLIWHIELRTFDLKYTWAISRNATDFKTNAFVSVSDGQYIGRGEAAPNVRYDETPESFLAIFLRLQLDSFFMEEIDGSLRNVKDLNGFLEKKAVPNALRFGIESAFVHFLAARNGCSVSTFLGLGNAGKRETAYTIPIMPVENLPAYFEQFNPQRFRYIKIKVNNKNLIEMLRHVRKECQNALIIDANEAYSDPNELLSDLESVQESNIAFIEQPFPAHSIHLYPSFKENSPFPVFADESITDEVDFDVIKSCFHGVNVKLMKAGGYLNGIRLLQEAKKHGLSTMVGCMVETGLGISSGLQISSLADYLDLDSFLILKENPFDLVEEQNGMVFLKENSIQT